MKELRRFTRVFAALVLSFAANAFAQSQLKLQHDSSWEVVRRQGTIRLSQVANLGGADTGPLFLSIYAKPGTGFDGTGSPGKLIMRAPIDALPANTTRNNIVVTTKARGTPPGEKFTTLAVEEQNGKQFTIADYVVFTSTYSFPRGQNGGVGSDDSGIGAEDIAFRGTNALTVVKRRADFAIEEIQNRRETITTGLLRLAVYATSAPYDGGADRIVVATRVLGELAPGDFYNHLQGRLTLKAPGRGTFYLTLALEEDTVGGFQTVTYVAYPEPRQF